jgi:hypothetical protein
MHFGAFPEEISGTQVVTSHRRIMAKNLVLSEMVQLVSQIVVIFVIFAHSHSHNKAH